MSSLVGLGPEPVHLARSLSLAAAHRAELAALLLGGQQVTLVGEREEAVLRILQPAVSELCVVEPDRPQAADLAARLGLRTEVADPIAWLQQIGTAELGTLVCLDLSTIAPAHEAGPLLAALARCIAAGAPALIGVPIGVAAAGEPLPQGVWSAQTARQALATLGERPQLIEQHLAEGSACVLEGEALQGAAELRWPERADLDFGGYLLAAFHLDVPTMLPAHLQAAAAPVDALAWHALRDANLALRRTNTKLARNAFARSGAAAGAALGSRDQKISELQMENEQLRAEVDQLRLRLAELQE